MALTDRPFADLELRLKLAAEGRTLEDVQREQEEEARRRQIAKERIRNLAKITQHMEVK